MNLNEFFDYKNELMEEFCKSEAIVKLVTDIDDPDVPNHTLPYSQIFPFEFLPETVDDGKTFICYDVDILEVDSKTFYVPALYIWEFTHKSKLRLSNGGGVRTDQLAVEIDKILNGSRYFGLGELNLNSVSRFSPITDYQGRVLTYYARDFNRPGVSKPVPSNRKQN